MRSSALLVARLATAASILLGSAPLLAAQPAEAPPAPATAPAGAPADAPPAEPALPAPAPPPPAAEPAPAPRPAPLVSTERARRNHDDDGESGSDGGVDDDEYAKDPRRAHGFRLALDLGFERAVSGADDRFNAGTPTLLPLGLDVSYRLSPYTMVGLHGFAALASRDDCIKVDSCRARSYEFGAHVENTLGHGHTVQPWIRYGAGYEISYRGGAPLDAAGHLYRDAFDLIDLRIGADFIVARGQEKKTARIGAFVGLTGGVLVGQSGVTNVSNGSGNANLDTSSSSTHLWFAMGVRGSLDP